MLPVLTDGSNRTAQQDVMLGGYQIPRGTMVWLFFSGIFNSAKVWGDPDVYRPVRPGCSACRWLQLQTQSPGPGCHAARGMVCMVKQPGLLCARRRAVITCLCRSAGRRRRLSTCRLAAARGL